MLGIIQLSYFGIAIAGNYRSLLITSLSNLKYTNGYNIRIYATTYISFNLQTMEWSSSIVNNINIMFGILFIPLIIAFILYIISKTDRKKQTKYQSFVKKCIC